MLIFSVNLCRDGFLIKVDIKSYRKCQGPSYKEGQSVEYIGLWKDNTYKQNQVMI